MKPLFDVSSTLADRSRRAAVYYSIAFQSVHIGMCARARARRVDKRFPRLSLPLPANRVSMQ